MTTAPAGSAAQAEADILAVFGERGICMTLPRRELAALLSRWTGPFSAEEVVARAPALGRATVYRTLRLFVDAGVLCKTVLPDGPARYSVGETPRQYHLVCISCGRVGAFRHPSVERILRDVARQVGEVVGHRLELYHHCRACTQGGRGSVRSRVHGTVSDAH
ncbi:MAG: Fur family transcriptional regulator [Chloroflexi bacterium]|nr:Fur family transcriptional regulator [Chloroflexota bacterium]